MDGMELDAADCEVDFPVVPSAPDDAVIGQSCWETGRIVHLHRELDTSGVGFRLVELEDATTEKEKVAAFRRFILIHLADAQVDQQVSG